MDEREKAKKERGEKGRSSKGAEKVAREWQVSPRDADGSWLTEEG